MSVQVDKLCKGCSHVTSLNASATKWDIFTGRNEVVAKIMFLHVSVILLTGGLPQCMLGYHPPGQTPQEQTPQRADTHPGADTPPGSRLRHTVNERSVRILQECILVCYLTGIYRYLIALWLTLCHLNCHLWSLHTCDLLKYCNFDDDCVNYFFALH